jgi:hypothetical protein
MGRPLMIQEDDDRRIERLKRVLGIDTKVDVLRAGMDLLEAEAEPGPCGAMATGGAVWRLQATE